MLPETTEAIVNAALRLNVLREEKFQGTEAREGLIEQIAELEEAVTIAGPVAPIVSVAMIPEGYVVCPHWLF
jgi:hypothetical protein